MKNLKDLRIGKGISQRELSEMSEISNVTICNIENRQTTPQADVRRRLEIVLNNRIDWMKTCGLEEVDRITWEDVEQDFRRACLNINGLGENARAQFLVVARAYLDSFEQLLNEKEKAEHPSMLLPPDVYTAIMANRKRKEY